MKITDKEIKLHLKLMNNEYLDDFELRECENWCNKLIETNYTNKLYNAKDLYLLLENCMQLAFHRNLNEKILH